MENPNVKTPKSEKLLILETDAREWAIKLGINIKSVGFANLRTGEVETAKL